MDNGRWETVFERAKRQRRAEDRMREVGSRAFPDYFQAAIYFLWPLRPNLGVVLLPIPNLIYLLCFFQFPPLPPFLPAGGFRSNSFSLLKPASASLK